MTHRRFLLWEVNIFSYTDRQTDHVYLPVQFHNKIPKHFQLNIYWSETAKDHDRSS